MNENVCCFMGHREIKVTNELINELYDVTQKLIVEEEIDTFLFGSKSHFNDLCYQTVSKLKEKYPHIRRIYVRAQFPYIDEDYKEYLLRRYEETYYPEKILRAGRLAYVERNFEMINKSKFCVIYFNENYVPAIRERKQKNPLDNKSKSGTRIAYDYALKKQKVIINIFDRVNKTI